MTLYVNGEPIEQERIRAEIDRLRPSYRQVFADQPEEQQEQQLAEWARENVIEATLFRQAARQAFPDVAPEAVQRVLDQYLEREGPTGPLHQQMQAGPEPQREVRDQAADQIRQEQLRRRIAAEAGGPSDKEVRRYYEAHPARFSIPEMVHAAHIVKHPSPDQSKEDQRKEMEAILERLNKGESFEQIAGENSDCPDQAGSLGFFPRGRMVQAFEDVAFGLKPGEHSGIFETEFGLHIAKVHENRPASPFPFEQARELIVRELTAEKVEKAIERFLDQKRKEARIEER